MSLRNNTLNLCLQKMEREPKVACVELGCILRGAPKNNEICKVCKPRYRFADAIENSGVMGLQKTQTVADFGEEVEFPILGGFERK